LSNFCLKVIFSRYECKFPPQESDWGRAESFIKMPQNICDLLSDMRFGSRFVLSGFSRFQRFVERAE
jgi:hypothetical protein